MLSLTETYWTDDFMPANTSAWKHHGAVSPPSSGGFAILTRYTVNVTLFEKNQDWLRVKASEHNFIKPLLRARVNHENIYGRFEISLMSIIAKRDYNVFLLGEDFNARVGGLNLLLPNTENISDLSEKVNLLGPVEKWTRT